MTHYEVLQVSRSATKDVIEAAWRTLMRKHHPDCGGNSEGARQINEAHDVLSDPKKRASYDLRLLQEKRAQKTVRMPKPEDAYPPGLSFTESMTEIVSELEGDLAEAVKKANIALLERLAKSNPMLQVFLRELKKKTERAG